MKRYKTIEVNEYERMLEELSNSQKIDLETFDLLLYGGGGQQKRFYSDLKRNPKCEVLWTGWSGPKWSIIFSFIPGQAGLVKIKDQSFFKELYYELASFSVSDAIFVSKKLTSSIVQEASKRTWRARFERIASEDPFSFVLTSEADETIVRDGKEMYFYDYYFGNKTSEELKDIIERRNRKTTHNV